MTEHHRGERLVGLGDLPIPSVHQGNEVGDDGDEVCVSLVRLLPEG